MKCRDVMTENPICCLPEDNVGQAARVMRRERVGSIPVVTDELKKELIGIITDRDLAYKVVAESRDAIRTRVFDVMTRATIVCRDDDDVIAAADWVIDLGPDAGDAGGRIVAMGPPDVIAACPESRTGQALHLLSLT